MHKSVTPPIIMSGMRPTGRLHLGHYVGVLKNWLSLQNQAPCYFMIADWHALTTRYDRAKDIRQSIFDLALDWLAVGIDPQQCVMYVQSDLPETAELHLMLSMITPQKWVETDPTLKDMVSTLHEGLSYGLLGYPVLQTADILLMRGNRVPVGKDQLAHLELSRDIARRFNHLFGQAYFEEPAPMLTETPLLLGLDGRKMSKSYNNAIELADSAEETWQKIRTAITDPARVQKTDPGTPENCSGIFPYYSIFSDANTTQTVATACKTATRGCVDCKKQLADIINTQLAPIRQRRQALAENPQQVWDILAQGNEKARQTAQETMAYVKALCFG